MRYNKKEHGEVRMYGVAWHSKSCHLVNIPPKGRCKRVFTTENKTVMEEAQCCQFNTFILSLICHQKDTQEGRHRTERELHRTKYIRRYTA